jgi:drug/metabolite transporter (DMT)-like permease
MLTTSVLSFLTLPFGWVVPPLETTLLLILGGIIGGVGQLCLTQSYRFAPASVVAPFDYTAILLAIGIGYVWFNEVPTLGVISGAALIVLAGVVIVLRERHLGIKLAAERQVRFK